MTPPTEVEVEAARQADFKILAFQVSAMQTSLDRGLGAMEKAIDGVNESLRQQGARLGGIERQLAEHATEIRMLQSFREEREARDENERAAAQEAQALARVWRAIAIVGVGAVSVVASIVGVLFVSGAFN